MGEKTEHLGKSVTCPKPIMNNQCDVTLHVSLSQHLNPGLFSVTVLPNKVNVMAHFTTLSFGDRSLCLLSATLRICSLWETRQEQKPCQLLMLPLVFYCHGGYSYQPLFAVAAAKFPKITNYSLCYGWPSDQQNKKLQIISQNINRRSPHYRILLSIRELSRE